MPYPLPLTRTEAYLAYKAGVIQQSDLKPSLAVPRNGIDAWLAYWTGLAADYPKREDGTPHILQEEEAYIAYLCGVTDTYPENCYRRVGAYLRYLISARWGRPDHPLNREELYLSLIKTQFIPSGDPSSDIKIDGTAKAPFVDVKMYGDTAQQTYTGKNLFNLVTPDTNNGVTVTANADGSFTLNGKTTGVAVFNFILPELKPAGTYTISCTSKNQVMDDGFFVRARKQDMTMLVPGSVDGPSQIRGTGSNYVEKTFVSTDPMYCLALNLTTTGVTYDNMVIYPQVEVGGTATDWERYVGGVPAPNPDYPQAVNTVTGRQVVNVAGKNLFNLNGDQQPNTRCTGTINGQSITITSTANSTGFYSIVIPNSSELLGKTATLSVGDIAASSDVETTGRILIYQAVSTQPNIVGSNISGVDIRSAGSTTFTFPDSFQSGRDCFAVVLYANARGTSTVVGEYSTYTNIQLELGSTGSDYEPYSSNDYEINLGKNLYQSIAVTTPSGGLTSEVLPDGRVRIHGKATSNSSNFLGYMSTNLPAGTYTFSITGELPFRLLLRSDDAQNHWVLNAGQTKITQTISNTLNTIWVWGYQLVSGTDYDITIGIQLEEGSTATPFAPYFTPIELCKIGDYQDYIYKDGSDWKIHKATTTFTLDGTKGGYYSSWFYIPFSGIGVTNVGGVDAPPAFSSQFIAYRYNTFTGDSSLNGIAQSGTNFLIRNTSCSSEATYKTWLGSNLPRFYYALATPTDTTITDQTLIAQLDALVNGGAEEGTTYIKVSATDPNLPAKLYVEAPKYD